MLVAVVMVVVAVPSTLASLLSGGGGGYTINAGGVVAILWLRHQHWSPS